MTPVDRSLWRPLKERLAQILKWKADIAFNQLERQRWADDGGRV